MTIFDRFVRYEWAEYALEVAIQMESPSHIKPYLIMKGIAPQSARRTANILSNWWFPKNQTGQYLKEKALRLLPSLSKSDRLILHWGMALNVFPLFRQTSRTIGALLRIQEEITNNEIITRIIGNYSNQVTIKRSVERLVQSFLDWKVLEKRSNKLIRSSPLIVSSSSLAEWLFQAVLLQHPNRFIPIQDLVRATEIFPFEIPSPMLLVYESPSFSVHRDANGVETIGVNYPIV